MLNFRPIVLEDRDWISAYYQKRNTPAAQYTFASNYIWSKGYPVDVCEDNGWFFLRYNGKNESYYHSPVGSGDSASFKSAVEKLAAYCREHHQKMIFHNVPPEERDLMISLFGSRVTVHESRDQYEYIYDREELAALPGKKFHGKRGHIKRFMETDWRYESLTPELIPDVITMHNEWNRLNQAEENPDLVCETMAVMASLENFEYLGLRGGLLYQDNRIVAYTIGEPGGGGSFAVHFEKAYSGVNGAYPAVNQLFIQHETEGFSIINREEDTGADGLRRAKLSYHPAQLLEMTDITIDL